MTTVDVAQVEAAIAAKQVQQAQIMAQLQANIGAMQALQALLPKDDLQPAMSDAEWFDRATSQAGVSNAGRYSGNGHAQKDHGEQ